MKIDIFKTWKKRTFLILCIVFVIILAEFVGFIKPYEMPESLMDSSSAENSDDEMNNIPFRKTPMNETIWVIDVQNSNTDDQLTAVSLQGIVNKNVSTIYLIHSDDEIRWLDYVIKSTDQTIENITFENAIQQFSSYISGAVVYDNNEISINLATTFSGIYDLIMIRKGSDSYGFEIKEDVTKYDEKTNIEIYMKYFHLCNRQIIANMNYYNVKQRDFIIQNEMMVLHITPGPFSWPGENTDFLNVISDFAVGGNGTNRYAIGWYDAPTYTEEDYSIQVLSHYGVIFIPGNHVPNLSFLQSINATIDFERHNKEIIGPENKVYITFSYADGDNIDIMYNFINRDWDSDFKEEMPVAWSVSPIMLDIAPIIMQYYYDTSSPMDSFIPCGSGLGAVFPDYFAPDLLPNYVEKASSYPFDYVWLLNSYTPYETRYSDRVLELYADNYDGVALDYGSNPIKNPYWKEHDTPFARSLHYMGDDNDMRAKLSKLTTFSDEPLFLFITIYPWVEGDKSRVIDIIESTCDDYEFVTLDTFFSMINTSESGYNYFDDTRRSVESNQYISEYHQGIIWLEGLILLGAFLTIIFWYMLVKKRNQIIERNENIMTILFCGIATVLYLSQIIWVIYQNYWQWSTMATIPFIAMVIPYIRRKKSKEKENYLLGALLIATSSFLIIHYPIFLIIGAIGFYMVIKNYPNEFIRSMPFSISIAFIISFFVWTIWILVPFTLLLILISFELKNKSGEVSSLSDTNKSKSKFEDFLSTFLPSFFLSLTIIPIFYLDIWIINIKMDYNGYMIFFLSILVPLISYPLGKWLMQYFRIIKYTFSFSWFLIWVSPSPYILAVILIVIQAQLFSIALYLFNKSIRDTKLKHRKLDFAKNMTTLPIPIGLFIIIPPMIYSSYLIELPAIILYLTYYSVSFMVLISLILLLGIISLERLNRKSNNKTTEKSS